MTGSTKPRPVVVLVILVLAIASIAWFASMRADAERHAQLFTEIDPLVGALGLEEYRVKYYEGRDGDAFLTDAAPSYAAVIGGDAEQHLVDISDRLSDLGYTRGEVFWTSPNSSLQVSLRLLRPGVAFVPTNDDRIVEQSLTVAVKITDLDTRSTRPVPVA